MVIMLRFLLQNVRLKSINVIATTTTLKISRKITPKTIKEQPFPRKIIKKTIDLRDSSVNYYFLH